jgi:protein DJ-1
MRGESRESTSCKVPLRNWEWGLIFRCSRFLKVQTDTTKIPNLPGEYTIAIVPGGAKGAATLSQSTAVQSLLQEFEKQGKYIGTICAGSLAVKTAGLIPGGQVTSHPSVENEFSGYQYSQERVVVENHVISSRGLFLLWLA